MRKLVSTLRQSVIITILELARHYFHYSYCDNGSPAYLGFSSLKHSGVSISTRKHHQNISPTIQMVPIQIGTTGSPVFLYIGHLGVEEPSIKM